MKTIDYAKLSKAEDDGRFEEARGCPHLAIDTDGGPALWHRCFCTHPDVPEGLPPPCTLVWLGQCAFPNMIECEIILNRIQGG